MANGTRSGGVSGGAWNPGQPPTPRQTTVEVVVILLVLLFAVALALRIFTFGSGAGQEPLLPSGVSLFLTATR